MASGNVPLSAEQLIDQLMELHPKGYDLSLTRISKLLEKLGNPQDKLPPVIHVAGTNGKGSFTAFARSLLEAEGHIVHVHTSPHLVNWHERFRIGKEGGGEFVEDDVLANAIARVAAANDGASITVFEILSAVMFLLFSEHPADVVLIEVGLGGRFDATNVITAPAASVIMPVSLDHQALLGTTVSKIAFEKAGIIKRKCPVIISNQLEPALEVLEAKANENACPIAIFGQDFAGFEEHGRFIYQDDEGLMDLTVPRLKGEHQLANAATAIRAVKDAGFAVSSQSAETAMRDVRWPGRFEHLPAGKLTEQLAQRFGNQKPEILPEILIDGGHNADAAKALAIAISRMNDKDSRPLYLISAMLNTKEPGDFFECFQGLVRKVITIPVNSSDAGIEPQDLAEIVKSKNIDAIAETNLEAALDAIMADQNLNEPVRILICGSLYLIGDALEQNGTPPR